MRDARRTVLAVLGAATWWLASCRDIPAPDNGILSISGILLPSPGLVAGDTMRDSTGLAAPLRLIAFAASGQPIDPQPVPVFVALDTGALVSGQWLIGSREGSSVRIVGGVGSLQSQVAIVKVTLSPDTIAAADSTQHTKTYTLVAGDTVVNSAELATRVVHRGTTDSGVEAVIVRYTIARAPPGNGMGPTVVLVSGNASSARDTTDAGGRASRVARLRLATLTSAAPETTAVSATASYRGRALGTVQFIVIFKTTP